MKRAIHNSHMQHQQPGSRWRKALTALALPATRVHNYRNLHKTMFYDALCELDCKEGK